MQNQLSKIINKVTFVLKKEVMLSVSLLATVVLLFITPPQIKLLHDIDWKTLATLFMLLSVLEGFKKEQIFNPLLKMTEKIGGIAGLTFFFVFSVFFSSMFVTNDVSLIIFVPLTIILFRMGNKEKYILPVLTFENIAAIRGSLLMPFGSPQNLFLFSQSGISTKDFIKMMFPLWIFSALLLAGFILFLFWSILLSQVISNVPVSIVLWPFTSMPNGLRSLLYGLGSAGLCSIIGSLASVINLRPYTREYPKQGKKFIFTFTWISLVFFAIVVLPQLWFINFSLKN
ncbi:MAG: SLC13 family permease [Treponema sp.]